jgi:hypothetical protein
MGIAWYCISWPRAALKSRLKPKPPSVSFLRPKYCGFQKVDVGGRVFWTRRGKVGLFPMLVWISAQQA